MCKHKSCGKKRHDDESRGRTCRGQKWLGVRRAMTLVELLVTLACIGVLLGLAVPGVGRVLAAGRSAQCSSNLRQMAVAATAYATTFGERWPAAILYFSTPSGVEIHAWDWIQAPGGVVKPGPLWLFGDSPDSVQQCPEFDGQSTFGADPHTGYNYNTTFIGAEGTFPQTQADGTVLDGWQRARLGLPPTQQRRTSETALFGDGGWTSGANKFMRAPLNTVEQNLYVVYAGGQAFRHGGTCNVVYLDGHCACASTPHRGQLATQALLEDVMDHPRNGFLSEDDSAYDPR